MSKDEDLAVSFEECVKDGTTRIALDQDTSINAAPKELQEEYELALVSGDEERLMWNVSVRQTQVRHRRIWTVLPWRPKRWA